MREFIGNNLWWLWVVLVVCFALDSYSRYETSNKSIADHDTIYYRAQTAAALDMIAILLVILIGIVSGA